MITFNLLLKLWPRASAEMLQAIADASDAVFAKYAINTPLRVAHFLAQCSHESGAGTVLTENLFYTTSERLMTVWPKRFPNVVAARPFLRNPIMLGRNVYNGRMGNRAGTDDGYVYRGRGLIQVTGRDEYAAIGKIAGIDLVTNPDAASANDTCLPVAGAFWSSKPLNEAADADDLIRVTRLVNGGTVGLDDRARWLKSWKAEVPV